MAMAINKLLSFIPQNIFKKFIIIIMDVNNGLEKQMELYDFVTYLKPTYMNCSNNQQRISISNMLGRENKNQEV